MSRRAVCIGLLLFAGLALPAPAQAACDFLGTPGRDKVVLQLTGNDPSVEICLGGGDDSVVIKSTTVPTENIKVVVNAGRGNDTVSAPVSFTGKLEVLGGPGNDVAQGGSGPDRLVGGLGLDRLLGRAGNDTIKTGPAKDIGKGGPGADNVDGRQEALAHIVKTCVKHVGPGESYLVIFLEGAPFAEFAETRIFPFTVGRLGPDGRAQIRVPIDSYGDHTVTVIAPVFNGKTTGDEQTITVTASEDCFPDPD